MERYLEKRHLEPFFFEWVVVGLFSRYQEIFHHCQNFEIDELVLEAVGIPSKGEGFFHEAFYEF